MSEDKAIHTLYERIGHLFCEQPYGELGRYLTYYAEDRLYLVFDLWYHGFYLVEAKSPKVDMPFGIAPKEYQKSINRGYNVSKADVEKLWEDYKRTGKL